MLLPHSTSLAAAATALRAGREDASMGYHRGQAAQLEVITHHPPTPVEPSVAKEGKLAL